MLYIPANKVGENDISSASEDGHILCGSNCVIFACFWIHARTANKFQFLLKNSNIMNVWQQIESKIKCNFHTTEDGFSKKNILFVGTL